MDERYSDCVDKLLEDGKTIDEICGAFPEYDDQIRKYCASKINPKTRRQTFSAGYAAGRGKLR